MFHSRDWQQKGRNEWLSFFTQHRKFGYDLTRIAQFDCMIGKQMRDVIEYESATSAEDRHRRFLDLLENIWKGHSLSAKT